MMTEQSRIVLARDFEIADLAGEKAIIDFKTGKYYLLKGAANDIWEHIQTEITVHDLVDILLELYEVDRETCWQTTVVFLEELRQAGFLLVQ